MGDVEALDDLWPVGQAQGLLQGLQLLFVAKKADQQWLWLAKDRSSEPIVGCHVGKRDKEGALGLWNSCLKSIEKMLYFIRIFGHRIKKFYRIHDILLLEKTQDKPIISNGSIIH